MSGVVEELRRMVPYYREGGHSRRSAVVNALRWSWLAPIIPRGPRLMGRLFDRDGQLVQGATHDDLTITDGD